MTSGIAFHCHHDKLYEWVYDYDERREYIIRYKPFGEQELRLRLFKMIPEALIPKKESWEYKACLKAQEACLKAQEAYVKAWKAYDKAQEAFVKAWKAYDKAWEAYGKAHEACLKAWEAFGKAHEACLKAREAFGKVRKAFGKAQKAFVKAWKAYDKAQKKQIIVLHKDLCPNCPWDGKTIFPKEVKK